MCRMTDMRLLIADDNITNLALVEEILEHAGYTTLLTTEDAEGVAHLCRSWKPDLLLLDLLMPGRSGYEVMAEIRGLMREPESLPVLVVTADVTVEARHRALSMGARDFVTKPIDQTDLLLRVRNQLQMRQLQQELKERNAHLDEAVRERTAELEQARLDSLSVLASIAEYHDCDTHRHTQRVGRAAAWVAQALELPALFVARVRDAAPLHDIGKIGISRELVQKPGKLTESEHTEMMRHVRIGAQILSRASSPVLRMAAEIALTHHERWDGSGYLSGLVGEAIPLSGRITAVADVFDALTHARSYKPAWSIEDAVREITAQAGRQFDPRVVEAFLTLDLESLHQDPADFTTEQLPAPGNDRLTDIALTGG
jgi:putative two-component system response regulator